MEDLVWILMAAVPAIGTVATGLASFIRSTRERAAERDQIDKLAKAMQNEAAARAKVDHLAMAEFRDGTLASGLSPAESKFTESILRDQVSRIKRANKVEVEA